MEHFYSRLDFDCLQLARILSFSDLDLSRLPPDRIFVIFSASALEFIIHLRCVTCFRVVTQVCS